MSLPAWEGLASEYREGLMCYVPPYSFLFEGKRSAAVAQTHVPLQRLAINFREMNKVLLEERGGDSSREEWEQRMRRWCWGVVPLVGRMTTRGARAWIMFGAEVLEGVWTEGGKDAARKRSIEHAIGRDGGGNVQLRRDERKSSAVGGAVQ
eukprot:3380010-Rhodomonas_salina.1